MSDTGQTGQPPDENEPPADPVDEEVQAPLVPPPPPVLGEPEPFLPTDTLPEFEGGS
jgi:hypothetical protein